MLDGSIVPTALGVNPSKTIAALAERGVEHLAAEYAALMSEGPSYEVRKTWSNHLGNQSIDPLRIYTRARSTRSSRSSGPPSTPASARAPSARGTRGRTSR